VQQPDGKLVALAAAGPLNVGFRLVRYDTAGAADPMFTGDPIPFFITNTSSGSLALAPDGKFVVIGNSFSVGRFESDGSIDPSFGRQWDVQRVDLWLGTADQSHPVHGEERIGRALTRPRRASPGS
jgi:hypothetical protein